MIARVVIPALVRGDELITKTGCYGDLIRECQRIEQDGTAIAAGIMIGNPFTDVPELCSQVLVMTDGDDASPEREATRLAEEFWPQRFRMQGKLIPLDRAVAQAAIIDGPVIFTDAADATSSGAIGRYQCHSSKPCAMRATASAFSHRSLIRQAAAAAHEAGVGAQIDIALGGSIDLRRFPPMPVTARGPAPVQRRVAARDHEDAARGGSDSGSDL